MVPSSGTFGINLRFGYDSFHRSFLCKCYFVFFKTCPDFPVIFAFSSGFFSCFPSSDSLCYLPCKNGKIFSKETSQTRLGKNSDRFLFFYKEKRVRVSYRVTVRNLRGIFTVMSQCVY